MRRGLRGYEQWRAYELDAHLVAGICAQAGTASGVHENTLTLRGMLRWGRRQAGDLQAAITVERAACVAQARAEGATWQAIGESLGCRKQAVQRKYGTPRSTDTTHPTGGAEPIGQKPARNARPTGWDVTAPGGVRLISTVPRTNTTPRGALVVIEGMLRHLSSGASQLSQRSLDKQG